MKHLLVTLLLLNSLLSQAQTKQITDSLFKNTEKPANFYRDNRPLTVSVSFIPKKTGYVSTLKFFKADTTTINYTLKLFSTETQEEMVTKQFTSNKAGWNSVNIPLTVVEDAKEYTFSLYNDVGAFVVTLDVFKTNYFTDHLIVLDNSGKYIYANATPEYSNRGSNYFLDVVYNCLVDSIFMGDSYPINIYVPTNTGGWAYAENNITAYEAIFGFFPPPVDTKSELIVVVDSIRYRLYTGRYWRKWRINPDGSESLIDTVTIK